MKINKWVKAVVVVLLATALIGVLHQFINNEVISFLVGTLMGSGSTGVAWKAGNTWLHRQHNKGFKSRSLIKKDLNDFMRCFHSFRIKPVAVEE